MDQIQHSFVNIRGLNIHVAEVGAGAQVVVFLHGFPEIWYSWRYQMVALAKAGFRAIAPDYRGYGLSERSQEPEKTTFGDLVSDLLAFLDNFGFSKVFLVAKDFGVRPASIFALVHPERVSGIVTIGVPVVSPSVPDYKKILPQGSYILRWQEPGRAEADFGRFDVKTVIRKIYILFSGTEIPTAGPHEEIMDLVDASTPLPPWFTDQDLTIYADLYTKSGFQTALQVPYRASSEDFDIKEMMVRVPGLFIQGEQDYSVKFPGREEYIKSGKVKELMPDLEIINLPMGTHFVQEQLPDEVNQAILNFLHKHIP